jgi:hypothetical protein
MTLSEFGKRPCIANVLLVLFGAGLLVLTRQLIVEFHHFEIGFSGVAGWSLTLFVLAACTVLTLPTNRFTLFLILAFGVGFRLITLFPAPLLSSDIYRYAWDGVVQHAHISPYRYVPGDPALSFLRSPHQDLFAHINRRDYAHTIYPPVAQMLFYCITAINASVTFMKMAMILFESVTVYALIKLLQSLGRKREEVLLYVWCPLIIWEIGSSGHLDSAAMAFIMLAILARLRRRPIATGLFLGAAVLIKFYPLVLFPALWQRRDMKMPATIIALAAFSYACYASVGKLVFGFLGGYVQEEGLQNGSRYFLSELAQAKLGLAQVPVRSFLAVILMLLCALALWSLRVANRDQSYEETSFWSRTFRLPNDAQFLPSAFFLALAVMLAFSPHYPWYVAWLIPFGVLLPNLPVFTYTLGLFYLCATSLGAGTVAAQYQLNCALYSAVVIAVVVELPVRFWIDRRSRSSEATA